MLMTKDAVDKLAILIEKDDYVITCNGEIVTRIDANIDHFRIGNVYFDEGYFYGVDLDINVYQRIKI